MCEICEVDGLTHKDTIDAFNAMVPETFPPLELKHFTDGYSWVAYLESTPVGFAMLVPFEPFPNIGYCKRCYVSPDHYGHGLQFRMLSARIVKAKQLGWTRIVSECLASNTFSANNFRKAGFDLCEPEQKWGAPESIYWVKVLS